jgi:hypothetical protein
MRKLALDGKAWKFYSVNSDGMRRKLTVLRKGAGIARAEGGKVMRTLVICGCGKIIETAHPGKCNLCLGCACELAMVPVINNMMLREWVAIR